MSVEISFIMPGNRPHRWHDLCDKLKVQQVPFEVIAVGPHPPVVDMPPWFTYIYSVVKPHQAHIIAAKAARGRLLCYWNDDWVLLKHEKGSHNLEWFLSHTPEQAYTNTLTPLVQAWEACHDEHAIVAPMMPRSHPYLFFAGTMGPLLPFGEVFSREAFFKNGNYDRRFIAIYAGNDYAIRMQAAGHPCQILDGPYCLEIEPGGLWGEYWDHDRSLLDYLWMEGYPLRPRPHRYRSFDEPPLPIRLQRKEPMQPFDPDAPDLAYVHQGPRGKWKDTCRPCYERRIGGCSHVEQPPSPDLLEVFSSATSHSSAPG